jgi:hydrogenase maturation protease
MESMIGYDRVILIDAIQQENCSPGSVRRLTLSDLKAISPTQHSTSPHDANLITALELGQKMGFPIPHDVIIYAIEVNNVSDFNEQPTPEVAAAIPAVTDAVLKEIQLIQ